jgi:hypothetical protein
MNKTFALILTMCAIASFSISGADPDDPILWLDTVEELDNWKPRFSNIAELDALMKKVRKRHCFGSVGLDKWLIYADLTSEDGKWLLTYLVLPRHKKGSEEITSYSSPCGVRLVNADGKNIRSFHSEKGFVSSELTTLKAGVKFKDEKTGLDTKSTQETGIGGWQMQLGELSDKGVSGLILDVHIREQTSKTLESLKNEPEIPLSASLHLTLK